MIIVFSHILAGFIGWFGHWAYRVLSTPPAVAVTQRQLRGRKLELPPNMRTPPPDGDDTRPLKKTNPPVWKGK